MKSFSINSWFLFLLFFIESNFCDAWLIFPLSSTKITDWVHPVIAKQNIWNNLWDIHVHAGPADKLKCLYMAGEIKGWFISILLLNFFYVHIRNIQFLIRNQKICEDHWSLWLQTNDCGKTSGSLSSTYMLVSKAVWTGHVKQEKRQPPIIWTKYTIPSDTTKDAWSALYTHTMPFCILFAYSNPRSSILKTTPANRTLLTKMSIKFSSDIHYFLVILRKNPIAKLLFSAFLWRTYRHYSCPNAIFFAKRMKVHLQKRCL